MFVAYEWCKAFDHIAVGEYGWEWEKASAGYVIAFDYGEPDEIETEYMLPNECVWIVPGTI